MKALLFLLLALLTASTWAKSHTGPRLLAVVSNVEQDRTRFSSLIQQLTDRGFDVNFAEAKQNPNLFVYGERATDHLLLLTSEKLPENLAPKNIIEYVNRGGNLFVGMDSAATGSHQNLAYEFGLSFTDAKDIEDEFYVAKLESGRNPTPSVFATSQMTRVQAFVTDTTQRGAPILYRGIGHSIHARENAMIVPVLKANPTAVFRQHPSSMPLALVSAFQAKNNARVTFCGSLDALSDIFLNATFTVPNALTDLPGKSSVVAAGNKQFFEELTQWTFQERSVLKYLHAKHHPVDTHEQQSMYRIKDDIVFNITLKEWTGNKWAPFIADNLQFAAKMIHPYVRQAMLLVFTSATESVYSTSIKLPDVYGVFTFSVDYKRPGYSYIQHEELVSLRPFRHDEYPRYITAAYPYYSIVFVHMGVFLVFCFFWLTQKPKARKDKPLSQSDAVSSAPKRGSVKEHVAKTDVLAAVQDISQPQEQSPEQMRSRKKKNNNKA